MESRCKDCEYGEYHGFPLEGSPEWEVGTIYFWCPIKKHHNSMQICCEHFEFGSCKCFDKLGNSIDMMKYLK